MGKKILRSRYSDLLISKARRSDLLGLQKYLKIRFNDLHLLNVSFVHKSFANDKMLSDNNERLEFLGDAILGAIVSQYLYRNMPKKKEGDLAKCKSYIVSEVILARIAKQLSLSRYFLLGKGEEQSGGKKKEAILSDMLEALIGAYFLDTGYNKVQQFVEKIFHEELQNVLADKHIKDYKSLLQEYCLQKHKVYPKYVVDRVEGPEHRKKFWISVMINSDTFGPAAGASKKKAEQNIAQAAFFAICNRKHTTHK